MTLLLAFCAGVVTVLSPCVLPLLPVILAATVEQGRWRPWGVLFGFTASFVAVTLFLTMLVQSAGLSPDAVRTFSGLVLLACGALLAIPAAGHAFEMRAGAISTIAARVPDSGGFLGGSVLGASLGLVWTPCVGPIMASVISLALNQAVTGGAFATALAYALGTALPMGAVIFGGRALVLRIPALYRNTNRIRIFFGLLVVIAALFILTGVDRSIQTALLEWFPEWENTLTGWEPDL
ncbi:cytochrome c biogenesis CcdA family protein [Mesorhizobium sp. CAU 1732]|uniref:cytochrome c biogenesis CcdA family protein n=1 Tax=Mesorhizobium sp. CAU 1732 TaxID=3140358 RepID=UPI00325FF8D2